MFKEIIHNLVAFDSIWSVVIRFGIWAVIALTIIMSVDAVKSKDQTKNLKSNLGLFLLFLILGGVILWLLYGSAT